MVCLGFGSLARNVLEHLFFEGADLAPKIGYPAFHLGNIPAVLGRRLPENTCLSADLFACKPHDLLFEYGDDVRHIFLVVDRISWHVAPKWRVVRQRIITRQSILREYESSQGTGDFGVPDAMEAAHEERRSRGCGWGYG